MRRKKKIVEEIVEEVEEKKEEKEVVEENLEPIFYILGMGENLKSVAKKFNTSIEQINELNHNSTFFPGNQIRVK